MPDPDETTPEADARPEADADRGGSSLRDGGDQPLPEEAPLPGGDGSVVEAEPATERPSFADDATGRAYERVVEEGEAAIAEQRERIAALEAEGERAAAGDPAPEAGRDEAPAEDGAPADDAAGR